VQRDYAAVSMAIVVVLWTIVVKDVKMNLVDVTMVTQLLLFNNLPILTTINDPLPAYKGDAENGQRNDVRMDYVVVNMAIMVKPSNDCGQGCQSEFG